MEAVRGLDAGGVDARVGGEFTRGANAGFERRELGMILQRVAGRDQQPNRIEIQPPEALLGDEPVALVDRVEAAAEQPDAEARAEGGQGGDVGGEGHAAARAATPLPASPTRGEVKSRGCGSTLPSQPAGTSPLVGEVGRGVAKRAELTAGSAPCLQPDT